MAVALALTAGLLALTSRAPAGAPVVPSPAAADAGMQAESAYGRLPLRFEANRGQTDRQVDYLARGAGYALFLTPRESVLSLRKGERSAVVRMRLAGGDPDARAAGAGRLPGETNYIRGRDPKGWQTGVSGFGAVRYGGVYPGIDLVYYGKQGKLEYDFRVAPGADPSRIALDVSGARSLRIDGRGDLLVGTRAGTVRHERPVAHQQIAGRRRPVEARFSLRGERVTFQLGAYDGSRPLVIDPVVVYSTFLGGILSDQGTSIAADGAGNAYVAGTTSAPDFPTTPTPLRGPPNQGQDLFVAKLNLGGTALVYSTYLGGAGSEANARIAVDSTGAAYLAGRTSSTDLPSTVGVLQPASGGGNDAFVAKLTPNGQMLAYLTYLGSTGSDSATGIVLDGAGSAYLSGTTSSTTFPTQAPFQPASGGGTDGFVTKLNASASALEYSSYLGGTGSDSPNAIDVDSSGSAYVAGRTPSTNFPTTLGAFDTSCGTATVPCTASLPDGFVTKLSAAGALSHSTFVGGAGFDGATAIAVGRGAADAGRAYITGNTRSTDFPVAGPALQGSALNTDGNSDGFVTKVGASGTSLEYSTYFGSRSDDVPRGIAVDAQGNAYLAGSAGRAMDFPEVRPVVDVPDRLSGHAFAAMLRAGGSALGWSTLLRGASVDALALDAAGGVYVTGSTASNSFTTQNPLQSTYAGRNQFSVGTDAFVTKLTPDDPQAPYVTGVSPRGDDVGGGRTVRIAGTGFGDSASVRFGDTPAANVEVISPSEIVATAPPHAAADTRVTVSRGGRTSPSNPAARFVYGEGRWRSIDPPSRDVARRTATLLLNGKVLLAGGNEMSRVAELFDPRTGTWEPTGSLNLINPIIGGGADRAVLLRSGKVLLVHQNKKAEVYDPATGTWALTAGDPALESSSLTTLPDGKVLSTSVHSPAAEVYDPATNSFAPTTGQPVAQRHVHSATLLRDGRVLLVAGLRSLDTAEIYNPATGAFTQIRGPDLPRSFHTATLLPDGRVLVVGGTAFVNDAALIANNTAEVYDPVTGDWRGTGTLSGPREDHIAVLLPNGRVLVAAGPNSLDTAELYDPATNRFRSAGRPNIGQIESPPGSPDGPKPPAIVLSSDPDGFASDPSVCGSNCGKVLVAGTGIEGSAPVPRAELYTPAPPAVPAPPGGGGDDPGGGGESQPGGSGDPPGGSSGARVRDTVPPVVSGMVVLDREFSIGSLLPLLARQTRVGTTIRFRLSEPAMARLQFARAVAGRRVGSSCRRATARLRSRPRCTRYVTVSPAVTIRGARAGANNVRFQGRLSRSRTLRPGRPPLTITATDAAGNRSRPRTTTFRLLRPPRRR